MRTAMKSLLFLLLLPITLQHCKVGDATQQLVHDTDGNTLTNGSHYYVLAADHRFGGGVDIINIAGKCKSFVQFRRSGGNGIPVSFNPQNGSVRLSSDLWIAFAGVFSPCTSSSIWHLTKSSVSAHRRFHVAVGEKSGTDILGLQSAKTFRIERYLYGGAAAKGYMIVSCAFKGTCKDVRLDDYKGVAWLAVSKKPLEIVFEKVKDGL